MASCQRCGADFEGDFCLQCGAPSLPDTSFPPNYPAMPATVPAGVGCCWGGLLW